MTDTPTTKHARQINNRIAALTYAASTDPTRTVLQGVHFRADGMAEATNGRMLLQTRCNTVEHGELPPVLKGEVREGEVNIPAKVVLDAHERVPKKQTLPVLRAAYLLNGSIQSTDLDTTNRTEYRPIDEAYPNVEQVIPDWRGSDAAPTVCLSVENLEIIVKAAKKAKGEYVTLELAPEQPELSAVAIRISGGDMDEPITGVVMPMRVV